MCRTAGLVVVVLATLLVAPTAASTISGDPRPSESVGPLLARRILQMRGFPGSSGSGPNFGNNAANQAASIIPSPSPSPIPGLQNVATGNPSQQHTTTSDQFPGGPGSFGPGQSFGNNAADQAAPSTPAATPAPIPAQQNPADGNPAQQQTAPTTGQFPGGPGNFGPGQDLGAKAANQAAAASPSPSPSPNPAQQNPTDGSPARLFGQQQTTQQQQGGAAQQALAPTAQQQQQGNGNNGPIPGNLGGDIGSIVNNAISSSRADAAASAITTAGSQGNAQAAANSIVQQSAAGRGDTIADAIVQSIATNTAATAAVLASAAATARTRGDLDSFADSQARAFVKARSRGRINAYAETVAQTITSGGDDATQAYGAAFAKAAAGSSDDQQALAEASAVAFCSGGSQAQAFASAYAVALSRDERTGCLVLSQARALAVARCNGGNVQGYTEAEAQSRVIGYCKKRYPDLPGFLNFSVNPNFNYGLSDLLRGISGK